MTAANPTKNEKADLRRSLLRARQAMHPETWREKSDRICANLQNWKFFQQSKTVLAYFSFRQEPDLSPLFDPSHRWGFSRCVEKSLFWHHWMVGDTHALQTGAYGIIEPSPELPTIAPQEVDLILVPAVGCDVKGYRLGYGGGFYDRMLSSPIWMNKPTIAITFEFARLPRVPIDPWDRPLKGICTEKGLFLSDEFPMC